MSLLCGSLNLSDQICLLNRYRVAARTQSTPDSATYNLGFRCVKEHLVPAEEAPAERL